MDYYGWENWESWNVYRWLTMDDGTTHAAHTAAMDEGGTGVREYVTTDLLGPAFDASPMAADFLTRALNQVDWDAVANEIMERIETP